MPFPHIRGEGQAGRMKVRLMTIVAEGNRSRVYLSPQDGQVTIAESARPLWTPDAALPDNPRDFKTPNYGMRTFADLFTPRQLVALTTFSGLVQEAREQVRGDAAAARMPQDDRPLAEGGVGAVAYADAVATYLGIAASKSADANSVICSWMPGIKYEVVRTTFSRQALPMTWDYAESNPFAESSGDFFEQIKRCVKVAEFLFPQVPGGEVRQLDATASIDGVSTPVVSADPPYYDNIGYADLSDFFYIWLRRSLANVYPSLFATLLSPKKQELIASPYRHDGSKEKAQAFFEEGLGEAFSRMRQVQNADCPLTVYYAFKQAETDDDDTDDDNDIGATTVSTGWETMLAGLIRAGFSIHGTWPMRTERSVRSVGLGTNALASSIVLVCRPRPETAPLATRKQFITALRQELPDALRNLQHGNIAPVDLAQAAIGPGMAVFTRYAKVIETDGSPMTVRTALGLINQALDEVLAEQEGEFDGDTRWALAWFEQFGTDEGPFGVAETLSKAKNTAVNGLVEAGVITARGGKVRLVPRTDLPADWDPAADRRLTVWEATQHLIRTLEGQGESAAAALLHRLGGVAETCRDLAYRLYTVCERKKWADEALAYNGLVIAWPELTKLALAERSKPAPLQQGELF
jgi:putative DNA methylase